MVGQIVLIGAYILLFLEFIWYFTCTIHTDVPLILILLDFFFGCIPGVNIFMVIVNPVLFIIMYKEADIELKNNWFNRKFLAYRE